MAATSLRLSPPFRPALWVLLCLAALVLAPTARADTVVTDCTENGLTTALAGGGNISFNCGSSPVTIALTSQKVIAANTTLGGGNLITLTGANTPHQSW